VCCMHQPRQRQPGRCPKTASTADISPGLPASPQTQSPATVPPMSAAAAAVARAARRYFSSRLHTTTTRLLHASTRFLSRSLARSFHLSLLISSVSTASARSRQIAFSFSTPLWPAGDSQAAAREASGSFIHPAAVVHPDAAIGQVKPPAFARSRRMCSSALQYILMDPPLLGLFYKAHAAGVLAT
jgi:hypothetical protein